MGRKPLKTGLQFISHHNLRLGYLEGIALALEGGCKWVQLRIKKGTDREVLPTAKKALEECRKHGATMIIDDRVQLAKELDADGVHLGKNDMSVAAARKILGKEKIIGGTANTADDIRRLWREGADYAGCGPFRYTTTKQKLSPIIGLEGYRKILAGIRREGIEIPVVAIGGIEEADVPHLMKLGISAVAVSGSILNAADPAAATSRLLELTY